MGGVLYHLGYNNFMKTKLVTLLVTFLLALTFLLSLSTIVNAKQNFGDYEGGIT
jgi:hypothetical protein